MSYLKLAFTALVLVSGVSMADGLEDANTGAERSVEKGFFIVDQNAGKAYAFDVKDGSKFDARIAELRKLDGVNNAQVNADRKQLVEEMKAAVKPLITSKEKSNDVATYIGEVSLDANPTTLDELNSTPACGWWGWGRGWGWGWGGGWRGCGWGWGGCGWGWGGWGGWWVW